MFIKKLINNPKGYFKAGKKRSIRFLRKHFYKGNNVLCENCSWSGKHFFNDECPNCKSLGRSRLIPFSVDYFNLVKPGLKVLHVAPNKIEYKGVKMKLKNVLQYDKLDIRDVEHVNLVEDLTQLTLKDYTYDLVVIWHVFEHIVEDTKAISEVYRILKPQGNLLLSVPIFPDNNPTTFEDQSILYENYLQVHGHEDHCRSCGTDYFKRFEKQGFKTRELKVSNLDYSLIAKYGLSKGHIAWCFTK